MTKRQFGVGHSLVIGAWALAILLSSFILHPSALAEERFPPPEFRGGYTIPTTDQYPVPHTIAWDYLDTSLLVLCLGIGAWLVIWKRSRKGMLLLTIFAVAWFGFVRKGCVCPIGSIQNVTQAVFTGATIPWTVAAFFALPLVVALLFGRIFCSGVCPLGAIQDLFVWKQWQLPRWLEVSIGLLAYLYLGLAVMSAAVGGPYIICQYDPFVPMFRLGGPGYMYVIGGALLLIGLFVGRPYCRFLCPYGVILRLLSRFSWKKVRITPAECIDCRLCEKSCPFGAIRLPSKQTKTMPVLAGKRSLLLSIFATPLIIGAFAALGYASADGLSLLHRDIQLARDVQANERGEVQAPSEALKAFIATGESSVGVYQAAATLRTRFRVGASLVGMWMGLVISGKLISYSRRRRRDDYTADPGACLACARCFDSCPVELKRRGVITELPVVVEGRTI